MINSALQPFSLCKAWVEDLTLGRVLLGWWAEREEEGQGAGIVDQRKALVRL
jgi:hypothetical protein